jgi:hypothetical protein
VPGVRHNGLPSLGNATFRLGVDAARPAALAVLALSFGQASLPFTGPCTLLVDPLRGLPARFGVTSPGGTRSELLPIPADPAFTGLQVFGQWGIDDPAGAPIAGLAGLAASRGVRLTIGS